MTSYLINKNDLEKIVDYAKGKMFNLNLPLYVSGKEVGHGEIPSLAILEATLMFLNAKGLFAQLVEIDYTHDYDDNDTEELEERKPVK